MALLAPFDRPLALRLLGEVGLPRSVASPPVPPLGETTEPCRDASRGSDSLSEVARFLARVLLADAPGLPAAIPALEATVDDDVVVWSPCLVARSRDDLVTALLEADDALTGVDVTIVGTSASGSTVYVEWRLEGRFDNAGFLNDDLLVEPSGRTIEATGVLVVVFRDERATHIRCYYDGLGVLEQVVAATDPSGRGARSP